jgi:hypothetical protein
VVRAARDAHLASRQGQEELAGRLHLIAALMRVLGRGTEGGHDTQRLIELLLER